MDRTVPRDVRTNAGATVIAAGFRWNDALNPVPHDWVLFLHPLARWICAPDQKIMRDLLQRFALARIFPERHRVIALEKRVGVVIKHERRVWHIPLLQCFNDSPRSQPAPASLEYEIHQSRHMAAVLGGCWINPG